MPDVIIGDGLCNAIDPDDDGDGYLDPVDENDIQPGEAAFKWDPTEQFDNNNDGLGDNGNPLTLLDDMKAEPAPFAAIGVGVLLLGYAVSRSRGGRADDDFSEDEDFTEEFMDEEEDESQEPEVEEESKPAEAAQPDAMEAFRMVLDTVWVDGILDPGEVNLLARKREDLGISFEEHQALVRDMLG